MEHLGQGFISNYPNYILSFTLIDNLWGHSFILPKFYSDQIALYHIPINPFILKMSPKPFDFHCPVTSDFLVIM